MNSLTALGIEESQIFRYVAKSPLVKSKGLAFELSTYPMSLCLRIPGSQCEPSLNFLRPPVSVLYKFGKQLTQARGKGNINRAGWRAFQPALFFTLTK